MPPKKIQFCVRRRKNKWLNRIPITTDVEVVHIIMVNQTGVCMGEMMFPIIWRRNANRGKKKNVRIKDRDTVTSLLCGKR